MKRFSQCLWAVAIVVLMGFSASSALAAISCYYEEKHDDGTVGEAWICYEKRDRCPEFPGSGLALQGTMPVDSCKLGVLPPLVAPPEGLKELEDLAVELDAIIDQYYKKMGTFRDFMDVERPSFIPSPR